MPEQQANRPAPTAAMEAALAVLRSVAASKANVLIVGESGAARRRAAEELHRASPRAGQRLVTVRCIASLPEQLESALFGTVKGAFPGAVADRAGAARQADGGTLFLDEIHDMPLPTQIRLLRLVQSGSFSPVGAARVERVDVRFVSATSRDMAEEVAAGRFREDLYYRLCVVPVELPALEDRPAPPMPGAPATLAEAAAGADIVPLAVMERRLIRRALRHTNGDVPRAAALLEVNPSTIYRKLQAWRAAGIAEDA
jgi:DNA-binding NtrC family response regulator